MSNIPVSDPFGAIDDPAFPELAQALDPVEAKRQFKRRLPRLAGDEGLVYPRAIRVTRHKPGRRCLVEYDVEVRRPHRSPSQATLIGKLRAGRFGNADYELLDAFWRAGFDDSSPDGISVPEPIATVPRFRMWLQLKVPGTPATALVSGVDGQQLGRRIAQAAHKVHQANIRTPRTHRMSDELGILRDGLLAVCDEEPHWADRIRNILNACSCLALATPEPPVQGIHRDFYADQVIVDGDRVHLIDFDLYCMGDPALDIGNFLGHLTEQAVRLHGEPNALIHVEQSLEDNFARLVGDEARPAVRTYATLTLARHISLSRRFSERRAVTPALIGLLEERLRATSAD